MTNDKKEFLSGLLVGGLVGIVAGVAICSGNKDEVQKLVAGKLDTIKKLASEELEKFTKEKVKPTTAKTSKKNIRKKVKR